MPVAHPGLMRLLDYKRYNVETDGIYAVYDAPLRDKPSDNWAERLYQRLVRPMPGLLPEDERVFRYIAIYPNTVIDLYPDHVLIWKMNPHGVDTHRRPGTYLRRKNCDLRTRLAQWLNLYDQPDHHPRGRGPGRPDAASASANTDFTPGPLSLREKGVAWFAGRDPGRPRRPRTRGELDDRRLTAGDTRSAPARTSPPRPARRSSTPPAR